MLTPPPYRAATRKARLARSIAGAPPPKATLPHPDRAVPRRDRAATLRPFPVRSPDAQSLRGSRKRDRSGREPTTSPPLRDIPKNVRIAAAPAFPRIRRASRGPHRWRPRIPAGIAWRRYPRSAAGIFLRPDAPGRNSAAPNKRDRDEGSRSGSAQIGKRVAASMLISSLPGIVMCPAMTKKKKPAKSSTCSFISTPRPTSKMRSTRW